MSGVCAIIYKDHHRKVNVDEVKKLVEPIVYDGIGKIYLDVYQNIGGAVYDQFGNQNNRLLLNDERFFIVCDTEIYNYKDYINNSESDTFCEVDIIRQLFQRYGKYWWKDIHGVYSAFIWDKQNREAYVFTDRIGIKPIVYLEDKEKIIITSRIKSIVAYPGFPKQLNKQAIYSYFFMEMIPTPYTIYDNINKLESGHFLHIRDNKISVKLAWKMEYPSQKEHNVNKLKDKIYILTKNAVDMQLSYRSNVKNVGCFLSGGTDSSTIAGLLNELYPGDSKTFSIGFNEPGYDEMYYARIAANAFKTKHSEYYVTSNDILEILPKIVEAYDEPFANSSVIPAYFCTKLAKDNGVNILLGGDGGDEIFGGNARYHEYFANFYRYPQFMLNVLNSLMKKIMPRGSKIQFIKKIDNYIKRVNAPLQEKIHAYSLQYYFDINDIFESDFLNGKQFKLPSDISKEYIETSNTIDPLDQFLYNDLKLTLMDNDLRKVTMMTELANANVRYPFLDFELVEFTGLIPIELKVSNGNLRILFKEAFKNLLPDEIIYKKKHGFGLPVVPWMLKKGKLNDLLIEYLLEPCINELGIFKKSFIKNLYNKSLKDNTTFYGNYLYYLLFLEIWCKKHLIN